MCDVPTPHRTTSEEDEIPRSEITPHRVSRDPTLSSTFTRRLMGALCFLFSAVEIGIGIIISQYKYSAAHFGQLLAE
jgi:hypothetical protein